MRDTLFPFQEAALAELHRKISNAHLMWAEDNPQIISFSAPTGAGKTIIMTTLFEELFFGTADTLADPEAIIVWLSDSPQLNEQTRMKIESKSDKIRVGDLVTIDSAFSREYLEPGHIYFLNTQKLGSDKLLTTRYDFHEYTIWETLTNTVKRVPQHLYVVIDEAHRGTMQSKQAENKAQSIMQKFIKGSEEDGLCVMPLVIGVTATPQKFDTLVAGTSSTVQKVVVSPADVRDSGLLKDRIILHMPEMAMMADMTTLDSAVHNWLDKCEHWNAYCRKEGSAEPVLPILVIQVEDGGGSEATHTDIAACLTVIEDALGRRLITGEVVHTFNDRGNIDFGELEIRQIEASRIQDANDVKVVFFKMNLSTGWDCPRAETMMSFRGAQDYTFIAQLLGRMIRTPLARRISSDATLNDVSLFLPYFDKDTAQTVIDALRDNEAVFPSETGTDKEFVTLNRNPAFADVFDAMDGLVTYRIDSSRKQPYLRLLIQLSRNLTMDEIDLTAQRTTRNAILGMMDDAVAEMRTDERYDAARERITGFALGALTLDYGSNTLSYDEGTKTTCILEFDITRHFEKAGKILGEGLHKEYWIRHSSREDYTEVQTEVIVLAYDADFMEKLESYAKTQFVNLYDTHKRAIAQLPEHRKTAYERLINASALPIEIPWTLPASIDWSLAPTSRSFERHMYIMDDGSFRCSLNDWETELVEEELAKGAVCWLRNVDRKRWALSVPYEVNGVATPMYPDFIFVRADAHGYMFDVLEPHDPSRKDNCAKAVGLAKFAEKHWDKFGKIQLIRKQKGPDGQEHLYRLDMSNTSICQKVRGFTSNTQLDDLFMTDAIREEAKINGDLNHISIEHLKYFQIKQSL